MSSLFPDIFCFPRSNIVTDIENILRFLKLFNFSIWFPPKNLKCEWKIINFTLYSICFQDDNWGENTTAVTGNTSEQSGSVEDVSLWPTDADTGLAFLCHRYIGSVITAILSVVAFVSPLAMAVLPKLGKKIYCLFQN